MPTPCSSTAAWTSAPRRCRWTSAAGCRITCSTCWTSRSGERRRVPARRQRRRETIRARGRTPILVGGSGLYVQAVIDEIDFPATDPELRAALQRRAEQVGAAASARPVGRARPGRRRGDRAGERAPIVRALEVIELTGRPFTASLPRPGPPRYDAVLLRLDRDDAAARSSARRPGAGDDGRGLPRRGRGTRAAGAAPRRHRLPGARLPAASRRAGRLPAHSSDAVSDTVAATRRFVRRQRSWFRRDRRMIDLDAADPALVDRALAALRAPDQRFVGRTLGP